jgi:hypothetical protein
MIVTSASLHGVDAGCPLVGKSEANCSSRKMDPRKLRRRRYVFPFGIAAAATRAVSAGMGPTGSNLSIDVAVRIAARMTYGKAIVPKAPCPSLPLAKYQLRHSFIDYRNA